MSYAPYTYRHWYVLTGECLHTMTGHTAAVNAVLIDCDGLKTISGSSDTTVRVWNTDPSSRWVYSNCQTHTKYGAKSMCSYEHSTSDTQTNIV